MVIPRLLIGVLFDVDELRRGACALRTHEVDLRLSLLYLADATNLVLLLWVELLNLLQFRADPVLYGGGSGAWARLDGGGGLPHRRAQLREHPQRARLVLIRNHNKPHVAKPWAVC